MSIPTLPFHTLSLNGPTIQFLHANAYPPGCYQKMLSCFTDQYKVITPLQRPLLENQRAKNLHSWHDMTGDIIAFMESQGLKNIIGMGHSMGGILTLLTALKRPDLFSKIILIDPVILPLKFMFWVPFLPLSIRKKIIPVAKVALRRRDTWNDLQKVRDYLGSKKVYQRFDPDSLEDFVQHGIKKQAGKYTLAYPKAWEAQVYATAPNMWPLLSKIKCPVVIIKGQYSDVITAKSWQKIQSKVPNLTAYEMQGVGHMLPLEEPELLAKKILELL